MAGSYLHATTKKGKLRNNESFIGMVDNLGDAYETVEEMYGMIWWLAEQYARSLEDAQGEPEGTHSTAGMVKDAQEKWAEGMRLSPGVQKES